MVAAVPRCDDRVALLATMQTDQILTTLQEKIASAASILITGQYNPDGDSIGSELALYDILTQQVRADRSRAASPSACTITIVNDTLPPAHYGFLPQIEIVTPFEHLTQTAFDVGFILDAGRDRTGRVLPIVEQCRYTVNIDHHRSRLASQENLAWVDPDVSSVAEMIYAFLEHPAWQVTLHADIATCLYTGLIYDTGSFRYPSTTARTLSIAAKLLETGIDFAGIAEHLFLEKPFAALQLLQGVLQSLQRNATDEMIWGVITQELLHAVQARPEQDEGIITQYAFTQGVKVAILFKEYSATEVKISLRSRGAVDVGRFARQMSVEGGGHPRAAGCTLPGTLAEIKPLVIQKLQEELVRRH